MSTLKDRFDTKYEAVTESGCWLWTAQINNCGYGNLRNDGGSVLAHRISYELHKGAVPEGQFVLHSCDTRSCVNPAHLHLGSNADNMIEMYQRERFPHQKITPSLAQSIYTKVKDGTKQKDVADEYSVDFRLVSSIVTGKRWSHSTGAIA